jgi:hypothetical protein
MGLDEYATKPPDRQQPQGTVEQLLNRATRAGDLQEYYSLVARRAALESEFTEDRLESNEEYAELVDRIETHRAAVGDAMGDMSSDADFVGAVREITDDSGGTGTVDEEDIMDTTE